MAGRVRALLVGIDDYLPPVRPLAGCGNDVRAMQQVLTSMVGDRLDLEVLRDRDATRERLVEVFRRHLGTSGPDDVAVFYFSGHGAQELAAGGTDGVEPDRLDETLVCVDSRTPGKRDLADKELAALVLEASSGGTHVVVILDCCHSGSGVRGDEEVAGQLVRQAPVDTRPRPPDSYALPVRQSDGPLVTRRTLPGARSVVAGAPASRYVLMAACEASQTAKEQPVAGTRRGVFTASLESALRSSGGAISYADLLAWVTVRVTSMASAQTPQLEVVEDADRSRAFLGGDLRHGGRHLLVHHLDGWAVDAGGLHGLRVPADGAPITFAVYPAGTASVDPSAPLARAVVTRVEADRSLVDVQTDGVRALDPAERYLAIPIHWPIEPVVVRLDGSGPGLKIVGNALAAAAVGGTADVVVAGPGDEAELVLECSADAFSLRRASDGRLITTPVNEVTDESAGEVVRQLQHVARWRRLRDLTNPATRLRSDQVGVEVVAEGAGAGTSGQVELVQDPEGGRRPGVRVTVHNHGPSRLFVGVLGLTSQFGVVNLLRPSPGEWIEPGGSLRARDGAVIRLEVPDALHRQGVTEVRDNITVLAGTTSFDAGRFTQPELDAPSARGPGEESLRERLTRGFADDDAAATGADWMASTHTIVTRRPPAGVPIGALATGATGTALEADPAGPPTAPRPNQLGGITLIAPAGLTASARVVSVDTTVRDVSGGLPAVLRRADVSSPLALAVTRGVGDDASVLELTGVAGATSITPDSPLMVRLPERLTDDESVLALAWDGQYWIPVGHTARRSESYTDVAITDLPAGPDDEGHRDLIGSVKILFRKLVGQRLGLSYPWPRLAVATVRDGEVEYDTATVAERVHAAQSVLVYVHGIIGDTRGQVRDGAASGLHDGYDVVLAFDYENLHTTIEENAQGLEAGLVAVGLGPGSGKRLDVVAHSMGGLVGRWFIEHGNGRKMVTRLVLAGTPSAGSPWPQIQDWATAAIGLAVNGLVGAVAWPAAVVAGLAGLTERVDNSLDQMKAGSPFLSALGALADPGVPYFVLCGDRTAPSDGTEPLLARLRMRATDLVSAVAFFREPNDIAVAVSSATAVSPARDPAPTVVRIGCDHMTYFSSRAGRDAVLAALQSVDPGAPSTR